MPGVREARKRSHAVMVRFVREDREVTTAEGGVRAAPGDAIVTGIEGEQWPVPRHSFEQRYETFGAAATGVDGSYRTLAMPARAVHMTRAFAVVLADGVSRLQGNPGDWLLDYGDGNLGVIADAIFRRTYELQY